MFRADEAELPAMSVGLVRQDLERIARSVKNRFAKHAHSTLRSIRSIESVGQIVSFGPVRASPHGKLGRRSMNIWTYAIVGLALLAAWYAFRPERLFIDRRVEEEFPQVRGGSSTAQVIETGTFHGVVHAAQGAATIYDLADGRRILRFTNFKAWNGPNVRVYLVAAEDTKDTATVKRSEHVDLGPMKGNLGNQNYAVGPDVDLSKYRSVSLWCKRFSLNFGAAPLAPEISIPRE